MAKEKVKKGVPNKHLHARIAFLHQAAEHLARTAEAQKVASIDADSGNESTYNASQPSTIFPDPDPITASPTTTTKPKPLSHHPSTGLPTLLSSHLKTIAQKAQIRLAPDLKHSICKTCSAPLLEDLTSVKFVENSSRGGRKPWANVVVVECVGCGTRKRFPVGAKRQVRKGLRDVAKADGNVEEGVRAIGDDVGEDVRMDGIEGSGVKEYAAQDVVATA